MKNDDKGIYAFYNLSEKSTKAMGEWIESVGIVEPIENDKLHVTTVYSKKTFEIIPSKSNILVDSKFYKIAVYNEALVLEVKSEELQKLNKKRMDAGAVSDYPTYQPHLTLSYAAKKNKQFIKNPSVPKFDILLTYEEAEPINKNKMKEDLDFEMSKYYSFRGWIRGDGTLLLPSSEKENIAHRRMALKEGILDPFEKGWVQFAYENYHSMLVILFTPSVINQNLLKGLRNLQNQMNTEKFNTRFGINNYLVDTDISYSIDDGRFSRTSSIDGKVKFHKLDKMINDLEQVRSKTKKIKKEETNSGSVDIYSNPASVKKVSSKIFKRIKEERNIKNWKEIAKEYNFECFGNESIKIENDSSNEWFFIKYGTLNI